MRIIHYICALAAIICLTSCASQGGLNFLTTVSNSDANSCLLNVTYAVAPNKITFTVHVYVPNPSNPDCTFQNLYSAPLFYNAPFTMVSLNLTVSPSDANKYTGVWQFSDFKANLGQSCAEVGLFGGQQVYTCRFQYSSIYFYQSIRLALPSNDTFDTTWTGQIFPEMGTSVPSTQDGFNVWVQNTSYPHIIARTENGCNTWVSQVPLSNEVLVLGTQWLGDVLNLHTYFNGDYLLSVMFLKNGAAQKNYIFKQMTNDTHASTPFNSSPVGQCTDLGVHYSDLLPNASYCSGGCAFSMILSSGTTAYVLTTNGVTTTSRLRI